MSADRYYDQEIETMERGDLDALIDERLHYTVQYAAEHSPFYRNWFRENRINPREIREHEDLLSLPVISGHTIRKTNPLIALNLSFFPQTGATCFRNGMGLHKFHK
jgi:phenylacetate-coenzyme A ligase PaaK-like adenylate-forming protein